MCDYSVRKAMRKQTKSMNILFKETGILCSKEATRNLAIGNAGLVTGLQHEVLLETFSPFGVIEDIIMFPGKSYCFVVFQDINSASKAYNELHAKIKLTPDSRPLYFTFAEHAPKTGSICSNEQPPGIILIEDFVTELEEQLLLNCVDWTNTDSLSGQSLKHRKVKHYGFEFQYGINNVNKGCPLPQSIPSECCLVFNRLRKMNCDIPASDPDQLTVNQYQPGQGIPSHIDTHSAFEDPIISLSLGFAVVMDFRHRDGRNISILLPQRSLLIMSAESRYAWSHGITPRKMDVVSAPNGGLTIQNRGVRTSFTFRWIRKGAACDCDYHADCDSYQQKEKSNSSITSEEMAEKLESLHVHKVYEEIASHFSDTRHKPWPNVLTFVHDLPTGSLLLDIGCGNGKYFGQNSNIFEVGCDHSSSLAKVCKERGFQIFNCNCLSIPLRCGIADGCLSIAVIHHLATEERRLKTISEMIRILKVGGRALIYVWAKDQERHKTKSSYLKQGRKNRKTSICNDENKLNPKVSVKNELFKDLGNTEEHSQTNDMYLNEESHFHKKYSLNELQKVTNTENSEISLSSVENHVCKFCEDTHQDSNGTKCCVECIVRNSDSNFVTSPSEVVSHFVDKETMYSKEQIRSEGSGVLRNTDALPALPCHTNRTQFQYQDLLVPWKLKPEKKKSEQSSTNQVSHATVPTFYRYYHVFEEGELEQLCSRVKNATLVKSYYDQGNWCVILENTGCVEQNCN